MTEHHEALFEKLRSDGRAQYDRLQKNLTWQGSRTDDQISAGPDPLDEMFGDDVDPETYRDRARRTQDDLDRQGREEFATEHASTQIKNLK